MLLLTEDAATEATGSKWRMLGRTAVNESEIKAGVKLLPAFEGRIAVKESVIGAGVSEGESAALVTVTTRVMLAVEKIVIVVVGSSEVDIETPLCSQHGTRLPSV
jgi:hypothetical protein